MLALGVLLYLVYIFKIGGDYMSMRFFTAPLVVAFAIAAGLRVDDLAQVPLSYPTYAGILGRAAYRASEQLHLEMGRRVHQVEP